MDLTDDELQKLQAIAHRHCQFYQDARVRLLYGKRFLGIEPFYKLVESCMVSCRDLSDEIDRMIAEKRR